MPRSSGSPSQTHGCQPTPGSNAAATCSATGRPASTPVDFATTRAAPLAAAGIVARVVMSPASPRSSTSASSISRSMAWRSVSPNACRVSLMRPTPCRPHPACHPSRRAELTRLTAGLLGVRLGIGKHSRLGHARVFRRVAHGDRNLDPAWQLAPCASEIAVVTALRTTRNGANSATAAKSPTCVISA